MSECQITFGQGVSALLVAASLWLVIKMMRDKPREPMQKADPVDMPTCTHCPYKEAANGCALHDLHRTQKPD